MVTLRNICPAKNRRRFYSVPISRTLFGDWPATRERARLGSPGRLAAESFTSEEEARRAKQQAIRVRPSRLSPGFRVKGSVTLAGIEAISALSLHYCNARAELAGISKVIADMAADPAERPRLWPGMLELLATP